jgi:hypothetical protein
MAMEALSKLKDEERGQALDRLRAELNDAIQKAYAERDEHLANYTRVRLPTMLCSSCHFTNG